MCSIPSTGFVAQGWLDITYLSPDGCFRLSRGNKGTLFVLVRDDPSTDRLLAAIASGACDAQVCPCCPRCVCVRIGQVRKRTGRSGRPLHCIITMNQAC